MIGDTFRLLAQGTEKNQSRAEESQRSKFRLFFLGEEEGDVEVVNMDRIDFKYVESRLRNGESVFISQGTNKEKTGGSSFPEKEESCYIHHF